LSNKFVVFTDKNPLTHILTSANLKAIGQRWVSALSEFNFDIVYRTGSKHMGADIMSRYPFEKVDDCMKLESSTAKAIYNNNYECTPLVHSLTCNSLNRVDIFS